MSNPGSAGAPIQPSSKGMAAAPKLNSQEMEMGSLPGGDAPSSEPDIMQIARVGDIPAMEKLLESSELDATYTDDEGITPLHVRLSLVSDVSPPNFLADRYLVGVDH